MMSLSQYPKIFLKSGKERSLERFHPWIFSGAIKEIKGEIKEGDLATLYAVDGTFQAVGHYQKSSLALRILSFKEREIDSTFWEEAIAAAIAKRAALGLWDNPSTNVFRLIHGEGDGLPGLIADWYNGLIVMQAHDAGMYLRKEAIRDALLKLLPDKIKAIYNKSEGTVPFKSGITPQNEWLFGDMKGIEVIENDCFYHIDVVEGQKTGFFIDQREHRKLLQQFSKGKKVLNTFCYSGGFSISALKAGAALVHSVDSSAKAIQLTEDNVLRNGVSEHHQSFCADVMPFLSEMTESYDVIILDPPAYAKHQDVLENALKGYARLNKRAFDKIAAGGILMTFSCSQVVSKDEFRRAVFTAAAQSKRKVSILYQLHQPADHPISIYHPEGEYLKGLVLYVE